MDTMSHGLTPVSKNMRVMSVRPLAPCVVVHPATRRPGLFLRCVMFVIVWVMRGVFRDGGLRVWLVEPDYP